MITQAAEAPEDAPRFIFSGDCSGSDLQAFHDALVNNWGRGVITLDHARVTLTAGLQFSVGAVRIEGHRSVIDASALTSGYALTLTPRASAPWSANDMFCPLSGFELIGPQVEGTPADGIFVGRLGASGEVSGWAARQIKVTGFRDGLTIGDQVWCVGLYDCEIRRARRYGINYQAELNSGENIAMHGGRIYDCHNDAGDAVAVYMADTPGDGGNNELFLYGTSLDYNDIQFDVRGGILSVDGHIEDRSSNLIGRVIHPGNGDKVCGAFIRGWVDPTDSAPGRAKYFEVSGSRAFLRVESKLTAYNRTSQIVDVLSGTPSVNFEGCAVDYSGPAYPKFGPYLNRLFNATFVNLDGWFVSGTGYTATVSNGAAQVTGAGGNGGIQQMIPCTPGQTVIGRASVAVGAISAGYVAVQIRFYAGNPTITNVPLVKQTDIAQLSAVGDFVECVSDASKQIAPQGAKWAALNAQGMGFAGSFQVRAPELVAL